MNFFERQAEARGRSLAFILVLLLSVAATVASVVAVYVYAICYPLFRIAVAVESVDAAEVYATATGPEKLLKIALASGALVLGGTLWKLGRLREGGHAIAQSVGGRLIASGTTDPDERMLVNVVEEIAIASGTPVPAIYLIEHPGSINALAAGLSASDAAIGVTRGAIQRLDRDELQGVIAHEFSHILNGDMRLSMILIGVVHGLLVLGLTGRGMCRVTRQGGNAAGQVVPHMDIDLKGEGGEIAIAIVAVVTILFVIVFTAGAVLYLVGSGGLLCARIVKAAIGREREHLADASAVQFTRNPEALARALAKIDALGGRGRLASAGVEEASHLFFGDALGRRSLLGRLLSTHPPVRERILRVSPTIAAILDAGGEGARALVEARPAAQRPEEAAVASAAPASPSTPAAPARAFLSRAGLPTHDHALYGGALLSSIPPYLLDAARDPYAAQAVALALLLSPAEPVRQAQLAGLDAHGPRGVHWQTRRLLTFVEGLSPAARLPLLDIAIPALRRLTSEQTGEFLGALERLVAADPGPALFAFALRRSLVVHLREAGQAGRSARLRAGRLEPAALADQCRLLLAVLALAGNPDAPEATAAFELGARALDLDPVHPVLAEGRALLVRLDSALDRLDALSPSAKGRLLEACARVVSHDGKVLVAEAELVRAFADGLGHPVPPLLSGGA